MSLLDEFPHTVDIEEKTESGNAGSGYTYTWPAIASSVKAWVQPKKAEAVFQFDKEGSMVTHEVYFTTNRNLSRLHRIDYGGTKLYVLAWRDASAGTGTLYKALCDERSERAS